MRGFPASFKSISRLPEEHQRGWYEAHYLEVDQLFASGTLVPVYKDTLPNDTQILPLHTHYKTKADGRKKARTCLGGNHLVRGRDYFNTFGPTAKNDSVRAFCAVAGSEGRDLFSGDIPQAYTKSDMDIDGEPYPPRYAHMPEGYEKHDEDGRALVVQVVNLYGDPVMGRRFHKTVDKWIVSTEHSTWTARRSEWDTCLYDINVGGVHLHMVVYVDDVLVSSPSNPAGRAALTTFAADFKARFDIDITNDFSEFLSMNVERDHRGVTLSARRYLEDTAAELFPGGMHQQPETPSLDSLAVEVNAPLDPKETLTKSQQSRYCTIVGILLYLSMTTRADVAYAAAMHSRRMLHATPSLLRQAERAFMYCHHTRDIGITYSRTPDTTLSSAWAPYTHNDVCGSSDADWCVRRSMSGWEFRFAGGIVAWGAKKQPSIALSTMEAEIMAGSLAACEAVFLRGIFADLGHPPTGPTVLYMDNTPAINLSEDPVNHNKAKHIERRHLHIRELRSRDVIDVRYIKSEQNTADMFTKHLPRARFQTLRKTIMNK